jgi:hypothetical protein
LGGGGSDASTAAGDAHDQAMQVLLADWTFDQLLALTLTFTHDDDKDSLSGGTGSDVAAAGPGDTGDWEQFLL